MGPKSIELVQILDQIIKLLQEDGKSHWVDRISGYRNRISESDIYRIEDLLSDSGGMGSFNDLVLGHEIENGVHGWKDNSNRSNEKPGKLQSRAFNLATHIKKDQQIE